MENFNPLDLSSRIVLVTGASSGIGQAVAVYLAKLGAKIVCVARNECKLQQTISMLEGEGHVMFSADLSDLENIEAMFQQVVADVGKLNGLVHCAGIPYVMPLNVLTPKHMNEVLRNNFLPFVELARLYGKKKYAIGGSIVTISSILVEHPRANETGYIAAKGAMSAAVGSLACDLAPKGIRVNGIICGNVLTDMVKNTVAELDNDVQLQKNVDKALLGMAEPEAIAGVVAFLISDMSRFITGRNIYADGGLL